MLIAVAADPTANRIALTAIFISGIVAFLSPLLAGLVQWLVAKKTHDRQRAAAARQRTEERRATTYVDMIRKAQEIGTYHEDILDGKVAAYADNPDDLHDASLDARMGLFGSEEVRELAAEWMQAENYAHSMTWLEHGARAGGHDDLSNIQEQQRTALEKANEIAARLVGQMRREMGQ